MTTAALISRTVLFCGTGHTTDPKVNRGIDHRVLKGGFAAYAKALIDPVIAAGCRRVYLSMPGGVGPPGEYFEIDAMLEAQRQGLIDCAEFAAAFRPYRAKGVEFIAYNGCMLHNSRTAKADPADWCELVVDSLRPFMDGLCSIGFDASSEYAEGSPEWHAMMMVAGRIKRYGGRVYAEAATAAGMPHFAGVGVMAVTSHLHFIPPPEKRHGNEVICRVGPVNPGEDFHSSSVPKWMPREIQRVLAMGYTPCAEMQALVGVP